MGFAASAIVPEEDEVVPVLDWPLRAARYPIAVAGRPVALMSLESAWSEIWGDELRPRVARYLTPRSGTQPRLLSVVTALVLTLVFATLLGSVAGIAPAVRAARMDPVTALRTQS